MNHSTRTLDCPRCGGGGRLASTSECPDCRGTGQIEEATLHDHAGEAVAAAFFQKFSPPLDRHVEPSRFGNGVRWKDAINRAVGIEQSGLPQLTPAEWWIANGPSRYPTSGEFIEAIQKQAFECGVAMALADHVPFGLDAVPKVKSRRRAKDIAAQLEEFERAIPKNYDPRPDDFAAELQWSSWQGHLAELREELTEAQMAEGLIPQQ